MIESAVIYDSASYVSVNFSEIVRWKEE